MSVANSFAPVLNNRFSRKWAGTSTEAVDAYISGFFFMHFAHLPPRLIEAIQQGGGTNGLTSVQEVKQVLHSTCTSVTIPGGTMNRAEFTGLGGVKWGAPTNVDFDNTVTFKFTEFSTLPIYSIFHGWVRLMRDYRTGTSMLVGEEGVYTKSNYTGTVYYWTTKPCGKLVEYYACLTGLFPLKDPTDQYGSDLSSNDKLELDIDFNCDYVWHEPWVRERCQSLSDTIYGSRTVIYDYGKTPGP